MKKSFATRKITVYDARTDTVIFECEGYISISNNGSHKTGANEYKKNYVYLNEMSTDEMMCYEMGYRQGRHDAVKHGFLEI